VNLIVQDGLKELDTSVKRVRVAVRYIKSSPARIGKFKKCLDVVTCCNSTYNMLNVAVAYKKVFERYAGDDPYYTIDLNANKQPGMPDSNDLENATKMVEFLKGKWT
jgi:hypothetical protein